MQTFNLNAQVEGNQGYGNTYRPQFVSVLHEVIVPCYQSIQMIVEWLWNAVNVKNI